MHEVSYADIGLLFRRAREDRHLSIEQAARELHIRGRYLSALENGRFADLPGVAYTKGYLQSYAAYLRLDKDEILRRFEQMEGVLARKGFFFPEVFSHEQKPTHRLVYGGLAAAVVVCMAWAFLLSPGRQPLSVVDAVAPSPQHITNLNLSMPLDAACFRPQDTLYPPCYENREQSALALAPKRPLAHVMQLANYW